MSTLLCPLPCDDDPVRTKAVGVRHDAVAVTVCNCSFCNCHMPSIADVTCPETRNLLHAVTTSSNSSSRNQTVFQCEYYSARSPMYLHWSCPCFSPSLLCQQPFPLADISPVQSRLVKNNSRFRVQLGGAQGFRCSNQKEVYRVLERITTPSDRPVGT